MISKIHMDSQKTPCKQIAMTGNVIQIHMIIKIVGVGLQIETYGF